MTMLLIKDWKHKDGISPLVQLVSAFEQLQRAEQYLYGTTYASDGMGTMSWAHWYDDVASAVEIMRSKELELRTDIAKRIGATITVFGA
jgi:hypothetical protein